jgi:hypothetical protein
MPNGTTIEDYIHDLVRDCSRLRIEFAELKDKVARQDEILRKIGTVIAEELSKD